jgi:hypothetical protein
MRVGFSPEIKGVTVDVVAEAMVCEKCRTPVMDPNMMNALRQAAADKYHMEQGLKSR